MTLTITPLCPRAIPLGLLSLLQARARLRAHGDLILRVHPALHEQLLETDLGAKLPVGSIDEAIEDAEIELAGRTVRMWLTTEEGRVLQ